MIRKIVAIAFIGSVIGGVAHADIFGQNVVGQFKVPIAGGPDSFSLISVPLHKIPVDFGIVTSNDTLSITDLSAGWNPGQYNAGVSLVESNGNSTFYIEITSSNHAHVGRHFIIASNSATKITIAGGISADVTAASLDGANYKIVPMNRVRDIFGELGEPVLAGGNVPGDSDNIFLYTLSGGFQAPIWYTTNADLYVQGIAQAADVVIDRDTGMFVLRRVADGTNLTVLGEVSGNAQAIVMGVGFNLVGGSFPGDEIIGPSGLDAATDGGNVPGDSDNVYFFTGGGYEAPAWYTTNANLWIQGISDVTLTKPILAGSGYWVLKRSSANIWSRNSPVPTP